jgi:hypothetical protein
MEGPTDPEDPGPSGLLCQSAFNLTVVPVLSESTAAKVARVTPISWS